MEELKNLLHKLQFDYYEHGANMHTIVPDSDIKPILEYIKNNFIPLEAVVSGEAGGSEFRTDNELKELCPLQIQLIGEGKEQFFVKSSKPIKDGTKYLREDYAKWLYKGSQLSR